MFLRGGGGPVSQHRVMTRLPVPVCPLGASVQPLGGGQLPGVDLHALRLQQQWEGHQGCNVLVSEADGAGGLVTDMLSTLVSYPPRPAPFQDGAEVRGAPGRAGH